MCVPCANSLKILGNIYVRGSASWGVIEEDLSGASSARVRFSVRIRAAHVRFFEASYVRRSDVFVRAKRWALENHPERFIDIIGDRSQCRRQVIVAVVWSHWVPSLQTSARALWSLPLSLSDHDKLMALP